MYIYNTHSTYFTQNINGILYTHIRICLFRVYSLCVYGISYPSVDNAQRRPSHFKLYYRFVCHAPVADEHIL